MADSSLPLEAADVLDFWFGELDEHGMVAEETRKRWWRKDERFDDEIRQRFAGTWRRAAGAAAGAELEGWRDTPLGTLALVVVLDQFPRNLFRDDPRAFSTDDRARAICLAGIDARVDAELRGEHAAFFYLPLMHSERRSDQHLGLRMFAELVDRSPEPAQPVLADNLDFMRRHFEIVDRFGRFPHRNEVLGRESTPEELAFLEQPGSSF